MTLYPYLDPGNGNEHECWVFDDEATGLKAEAFVLGMSEMIDRIVEAKRIPDAAKGFAMTFGAEPFEGADVQLKWLKTGAITFEDKQGEKHTVLLGNWYGGKVAGKVMVGWLCPALLKYFPMAPLSLYVKGEALPIGLDPIWHKPEKELAYVNSGDIAEDDKWWIK